MDGVLHPGLRIPRRRWASRARWALGLAATCVSLAVAPAADADRGVLARSGDKLTTEIGAPGDSDAFALELVAGGQLRADAKAAKGSSLLPALRLFDPAGTEHSLTGLVRREGTAKPLLKKFAVPVGGTGVWTLTVDGGAAGSGAYTAGFKVKTPTKWKAKKVSAGLGETVSVPFAARSGALVTVVVKNKGSTPLAGVRVVSENGDVLYAIEDFAPKRKSLVLKKRPLPGGTFGVYRVELVGPAAGVALSDVSIAVKLPKVAKRKVTLPPEAGLAGAAPDVLRQGDAGAALVLTGTNLAGFAGGARVVISGEGVSVSRTTVSGGRATAIVAVAADAPYGARDVTFVPPVLEGEPVTLPGAITVEAPLPQVLSISPAVVRQAAGATTIDVTGTGFRAGGVVTISGAGLTVGAVELLSETLARVAVSASAGATIAPRDLTWTQPGSGGGAQATLAAALAVHAPTPTVAAVSPVFLRQGDAAQTLTVTGSGFRSSGALTISGADLTVGAANVVSDGMLTVSVTVDEDAAVGTRDVTYAQAAAAGGASATATSALTIRNPLATVSAVSPSALTQGDSGVTLTVTGTGFRSGGALSIAGSGLTLSGQTFVSATSFRATIAAADSAALGAHDVTYTQPAAGGGEAVTLGAALQVDAPAPAVTGASPAVLRQDDVARTLTVTGTGFRDGGTITVAGGGLTLGATTVVSATTAAVPVTVAADAAVGLRDVTFTQPAAGGALSATATSAVTVQHPLPMITSVSPTIVRRSESGTLTVTGTGFRSGGALTTSSSDVTLTNVTHVSATTFTASYSVGASAALGTADVTYTQPGGSGGGASVTASAAYEILAEGPALTSLSPDRMLPGTSRAVVIATGTNFTSGSTVSVGGAGVTVHATTVDSSTQLTLDVSVASGAALGARSVTITPGSGPAVVFSSALRVIPAAPTVTAFSHATLAQGASGVAVTVNGTNFRAGAVVSASGSGVTFTSVSVVSATKLTATAAVTGGAATGLRSLTVAHPSSVGGASGSLAGALRVIGSSPTVTAANPSKIAVTGSGGPTRVVPVTITGTNFMSGATVSLSRSGGSGVSVVSGSTEVLSATSLTCDLSITGAATTGTWDVLVSNPGSLGTSGTSGNGKVDVKTAGTRTVNRALSFDAQPHGGERVTVHGGGFAAGDVVDFGAQRGYLCQVIDQNTIVVTVPPPASTSSSAATSVDVKVTASGSASATLTGAYTYPRDDVRLVTETVFPAQGATGVPQSLRSACVRLTAPMDTTTVTYGTTSGTNVFWFESGSFVVSGGQRAFGPQNRWLVFTRSTTSVLPINNAGKYILDIPVAVKSIAGSAFAPTRISSTTNDQQSFTITTSTDTTAPTVTRTPANSATGVSTTASVKLVFNEEIDPQYVRSANLTLKQGGTTIATVVALDDDLKTVHLYPETELSHSTTYTVTVTSSIKDLHGNAFSQASSTFTTGGSTDTTSPTIDAVVIEDLPSGMDGSTTYVSGNDSNASGAALTPGSSVAFDLLLPRSGFELLVTFSDAGGAGIDPSSFSAKCSAAIGGASANAELASKFDVTSTRARWRLGASDTITAGDNVTFTFAVKDTASNVSSNAVITIDVLALTTSTAGSGTGDLDPFGARDSWVLRTDIDAYAATFATTSSPAAKRGVTTTQQTDNVPDFAQALELIGLNSAAPTSAAQSTTNGGDTGTNAIMRRLVVARIREIVRERFEIDEDGARDAGAVDVEFLLAGEQGSLTSLPTYGTAPSGNATTAHNEMSLGATDGAESSAYATSSTLGRASYDARNARKQLDINTGSTSSPTGIHLMGMFKLQVNNAGTTDVFRTRISTKFVAIHGGTPVGEHASDDDVLAGSFDRTTSTNTTHNTRYDDIMDAVETVALYVSTVLAHEVGHSLGLVPNSAPKTGLFGWAHRNNTFTAATSTSPNTSSHLNFGPPRSIMAPAVSMTVAVRTGADFMRFNPLLLAHLRRRVIYDEGR